MSVLKNTSLNEYITLYLNDMEDYDDNEKAFIIAESTLTGFKKLLTESKKDGYQLLNEQAMKSEQKWVYQDLIKYIDNM